MMQSVGWQVISVALLTIGISTGCQGEKIADLEKKLTEMHYSNKKLAAESDTLKANLDNLRKENEELRAQLSRN